jgi:uncharacterized membrane protein YcaP (DUF421 family)
MVVTGKEKAFIGGLGAGITSLAGQVAVNQQITLKEVGYAVATWLITHIFVYYTTNTSAS